MARKLTPLQQEYKKEYNRLRKGFSRYKKEGYYFPENVVQKAPKRVTKQMVQSIKNIKPKQLTTVAEKVSTETGELVQETKQKSLKKISQTKVKKSKPKQIQKPIQIETPKIEIPETPSSDFYRDDSWDTYNDYYETDYDSYEQEYYPNMNIIDTIRDRIEELPDVTFRGKGVQITGRKHALISILDDMVSFYEGDAKAMYYYTEHLKDNQQQIFDALDTIKYSSKDEKVEATFAEVGYILNFSQTLSPNQAEALSFMQEMYY